MYDKYTIKNGDTLDIIAKKFNMPVDMLKDINNINSNNLSIGTQIIVPKNKESYFEYYVIEKGDNLYQIGLKYNINPELLATLNGLNMEDFIYPGQEILIPKNGYSYYITTQGDTLNIVADRFNTSKEMVIKENDTIYLLPDQLLAKKNK